MCENIKDIPINLVTATIAWIVSIIVSLLTIYFSRKNEKSKLINEHVKELIKKRIELYPELVNITQNIWKTLDSYELSKKALEEIKKWKYYILYSNKSFEAYNKLKDVLKKNPEQNNKYSERQRKNIWEARNSFRWVLRDDLDLTHKYNNWEIK